MFSKSTLGSPFPALYAFLALSACFFFSLRIRGFLIVYVLDIRDPLLVVLPDILESTILALLPGVFYLSKSPPDRILMLEFFLIPFIGVNLAFVVFGLLPNYVEY